MVCETKYNKNIVTVQLFSTNLPFLGPNRSQTANEEVRNTCAADLLHEPFFRDYFSLSAAWAAARRAMGTRNGEQLT